MNIKGLAKEQFEVEKQAKATAEALKKVVEPAGNMRQQLTGMLIWMHTFRVFGEYSVVLKNQFVMLGNSLGMILNMVLIPLYPLLIGITLVFYKIAAAVNTFFKLIGNTASVFVSFIFVTFVLTKLFSSTILSLTAFAHSLNRATVAAALSPAGMKGGMMAFAAANPILIGVSLGLIGVYLLQILGVLKIAGNLGKGFRKFLDESLKPWLNFTKTFISVLVGVVAWIANWLKNPIPPTTGVSSGVPGEVGYLTKFWENLKGVWEGLKLLWEDITKAFRRVRGAFEEFFRPIWESLKEAWRSVKSFYEERISPIWESIKEAFRSLKSAYDTYLKPVFESIKRLFGKGETPEGATPKNTVQTTLEEFGGSSQKTLSDFEKEGGGKVGSSALSLGKSWGGFLDIGLGSLIQSMAGITSSAMYTYSKAFELDMGSAYPSFNQSGMNVIPQGKGNIAQPMGGSAQVSQKTPAPITINFYGITDVNEITRQIKLASSANNNIM